MRAAGAFLPCTLLSRSDPVAIYHLSVKAVSRSTGRSTVAAAAYRAGVLLEDRRQGIVHDYTRKSGINGAFIVAPPGAIWAQDRDALWNAAEAAEKRKDAKVGREYEIALPTELDAVERERLARDFATAVVERYGVAADVAIHEPGREGDQRNHHAHILTTTRVVGADGLGAKTRLLDVSSSAKIEVEQLRELWARQVNEALKRHHVDQRVDHRSLERQGIDAAPTMHMGPAATAMERKAARNHPGREPVTDLGQRNEKIREHNQLLDAARHAREIAQDALAKLEKHARRVLGLARKIGKRVERKKKEEMEIKNKENKNIEARKPEENNRINNPSTDNPGLRGL